MPKKSEPSDAAILQKGDGFVVDPGCARVSGSDLTFTIVNLTEFSEAVVQLPASRVAAREPREKRIPPGKSADFKLWKQNGSFEYRVLVDGQRAQANSDPVIIIDPPCP